MTENTEITLKDEERQPCEIWTRVMGYFRPMSEFNIGKKASLQNAVISKKRWQSKNAPAWIMRLNKRNEIKKGFGFSEAFFVCLSETSA